MVTKGKLVAEKCTSVIGLFVTVLQFLYAHNIQTLPISLCSKAITNLKVNHQPINRVLRTYRSATPTTTAILMT